MKFCIFWKLESLGIEDPDDAVLEELVQPNGAL